MAISSTQNQHALVHSWEFPDSKKRVELIRTVPEQLFCRVLDTATGQMRQRPTSLKTTSWQDFTPRIAYDQNGPTLCAQFVERTSTIVHRWLAANKEAEVLLVEKEDLTFSWRALHLPTNRAGAWNDAKITRKNLHVKIHAEISEISCNLEGIPCGVQFELPLRIWISAQKKIQLFWKTDRLVMEIFDLLSGSLVWKKDPYLPPGYESSLQKRESWCSFLNRIFFRWDPKSHEEPQQRIERAKEMIRSLCQKQPEAVVDFQGAVSLRLEEAFPILHQEWVLGEGAPSPQRLRLLGKPNDRSLVCLYYDQAAQVSRVFPLSPGPADQTVAERVSLLRRLQPKTKLDSTGIPQRIEWETRSLLSPDTTVSNDRWTVTLISSESCSEIYSANPSLKNVCLSKECGHAALLIEGIDESGFFMEKAHFVGIPDPSMNIPDSSERYEVGHVSSKILSLFSANGTWWIHHRNRSGALEDHPLYTKKTSTWEKDRSIIEQLRDFIQRDKSRDYLFNQLGGDSLLVDDELPYVEGVGFVKEPKSLPSTLLTGALEIFFIAARPIMTFNHLLIYASLSPFVEMDHRRELNLGYIGEVSWKKLESRVSASWRNHLIERYGAERVKIFRSQNCLTWAKSALLQIGICVPENILDGLCAALFGRFVSTPRTSVDFE